MPSAIREGVIAEVMETWPLQLLVDGEAGRFDVTLTETMIVRRTDGSPVDPASLRPGQTVRIEDSAGTTPSD